MGFLDVITAPITAPVNALTSAWNDFSGKTAAEMQINAAKQNTAQQIAWERERATHAHQWEVEDLEKAGLNPILSAGGSGAATGGISPQMPDTSSYKGFGAIIPLISTMAGVKNTIASANKANAEANLLDQKTLTEKITQTVQSAVANKTSEEALGLQIMNLINKEKHKQAVIDTEWYEPEKILNFSTKAIGPIIDILKSFGFFKLANNLKSGGNLPGNRNFNPGGNYQQNNYYYR